MGRDVDDRKKRAALRKLRKAAELAEQGKGPPLSDWERQFLEEVEERIEKYGSAFADPLKGQEGEALSQLQHVKLKEIDKKARGKGKSGFGQTKGQKNGQKNGLSRRPPPRGRDISDDIEDETPVPDLPDTPPPVPQPAPPPPRPSGRPAFRVIEGGKTDKDS
ncbi:MAG: hypothetical protein KDA53_16070 [Hyphomonas sp.]|nr:hypothetical protein [Hyphomonas sp.]